MEKHKKQRKKLAAMLMVLIVLLSIGTGCQNTKENDVKSFFELMDLEKDQIQAVYIEYDGVRIPMEESGRERVLSSLDLAQPRGRLSLEPFTKSEYQLILETKQEVRAIDLCWFIGKEYDEEYHITGYSDRRFDVLVVTGSSGAKIVSYPCREEADLVSGCLYLLCLQKQDESGIYQLVDETCSCGVVVGDRVYPRYNTEIHPFYDQPLEEIRQYAASTKA